MKFGTDVWSCEDERRTLTSWFFVYPGGFLPPGWEPQCENIDNTVLQHLTGVDKLQNND